jgi:hypothetical protein
MWRHGDFAEWTEHGGMVIHGRSDATLNPQGVQDRHSGDLCNQAEQVPEIVGGASASARSGTTTFASCCSFGWRQA